MSEPAPTPHAEPTVVETSAPETPPKLLSKLEIGVFLGIVVVLQCALAYFFLPSATPATAHTPAHDEEVAKKDEHAAEPAAETDDVHAEQMEVDLGQFSLTSFDPTSNTTLLIDFHLYGTVMTEHKAGEEEGGEGGHGGHGGHGAKKGEAPDPMAGTKFGKLYKKNKIRMRDQVITIIRNAEMADLADPGLGLIKRQILAKTNALLGEPLLKGVIFSDFAVVEQ